MEPRYGAIALAYVERNPVRAGMVDVAEEYPWSSAGARLGLREPPEWLELADWKQEWSAGEWRELLRDPRQEEPFRLELRDATMAGLPLGEGLRRELEEQLGKRLRPGEGGSTTQACASGRRIEEWCWRGAVVRCRLKPSGGT